MANGELESQFEKAPELPVKMRVRRARTCVAVKDSEWRYVAQTLRNDEMAEVFYGWIAQLPEQQRVEVLVHLLKIYSE